MIKKKAASRIRLLMKVNSVAFGFVSNVCLKCCWLVKCVEYLIVIWFLRVFAV